MKTIVIKSDKSKTYCRSLLEELPIDGTKEVIFKSVDTSSTAKQQGLQWLWNGEVAASGVGRDDTKQSVHITAKWLFATPILLRDDLVFGAVYAGFSQMVEQVDDKSRKEMWREFTEYHISTQRMTTKQRAEYLRDFERYWIGKGVELTDPKMQGVDLDQYVKDSQKQQED